MTFQNTYTASSKNLRGQIRLIIILLLFLLFLGNCGNQVLVPRNEAYNEIYFALRAKANECGVEIPRLPILVAEEVSRRNLDLCTIAITTASCSSIDYPLPCLLLYFSDDQGDIPWYANFTNLSKVRVNL
ncbi:MAG: hypothetical protein MH321_18195 [Leptospiraceae bacterium]|nr:hypothetical protein [Leptospiraceae bacterium]